MKSVALNLSIFLGCLVPSVAPAAVSNSSAILTSAWSLDLADALPQELEKAAFAQTGNVGTIPCAHGRLYMSEGGNIHGGWSVASAVCHRNASRNAAHWVIHMPQYPGSFVDERRVVGIDCSLSGSAWRCKKRVKMRSPVGLDVRPNSQKEDADALNYIKIH